MNWLKQLYETYEENKQEIGEIKIRDNGQEYTLLPIAHTTQNAHIEVYVTSEGRFHSAYVIDKEDTGTTIPTTEDSANRAGAKVAPYPLHDKLVYVAGDYSDYTGENKTENFNAYIKQLEEWANSLYTHEDVKSVYEYLKNATLISDLIMEDILHEDSSGKLLKKWSKEMEEERGPKPDIFKVLPGDQQAAFIRFRIHDPVKEHKPIWKNKNVFNAYVNFYESQFEEEDLCFVLGKRLPKTTKHASKIRNAADKAKLISANDTSGFTFRGRFTDSEQVAGISYEASQKAHNALKWLIRRQGTAIGERVFLVWGQKNPDAPDLRNDSLSLTPDIKFNNEVVTKEGYAKEFSKALKGYRHNLPPEENVNIIILDAATTGRLGVLYYKTLIIDDYLDRLRNWHTTTVWKQSIKREKEKIYFFGAPSLKDIAYAAYGFSADDKIIRDTIERLIPSIIDQRPVPTDLARQTFQRASSPESMQQWMWEKTLGVSCALINNSLSKKGEGKDLAIEYDNEDRSYLFGRLLASADVLERRAHGADENRPTNAIRYMSAFSKHPARTWKVIREQLLPYQQRLGRQGIDVLRVMESVESTMHSTQYNDQPLTGLYLLGFSSQREELFKSKKDKEGEMTNE
ncbi:type I-C CRISPR-associated protein Cas8c/Csd1 [Salimicrobium jeotgali]|uniref:Type I-C CRISPR-associated protein Cas8c/Csd1 n=1 Tax=Salimicrobium jeotgali TaxID=1230341 RepID=K2GJC4_9BACI|nr:type I-C CRISPR-associated protein Cas8c/Csd1 [Salimicrobium jeotgali]AKG04810.1 type I-C CRISPR-associated protein Cas8c/Csd1 [Salimicrobium jeotgali]EKE30554.1 hypothetical protein MJ3_12799 [Salimicrobium jeotgali]MBM7696785.1 CRISPR-associated protein Csd1 [Salimicrobium jeotgali]